MIHTTRTRRPQEAFAHLGVVAAAVLTTLTGVRWLATSHGDLGNAWTMIRGFGVGSTILAAVVTWITAAAPLVFVIGVMLGRRPISYLLPDESRWARWITAGGFLAMMALSPLLVAVIAVVAAPLLSRVSAKSYDRSRELPMRPDDYDATTGRWDYQSVAVAWFRRNMVRTLVCYLVALAVVLPLTAPPWLPAERLALKDGREQAGYVISSSGALVVLDTSSKLIDHVGFDEVESRERCKTKSLWTSTTVVQWMVGPAYERC